MALRMSSSREGCLLLLTMARTEGSGLEPGPQAWSPLPTSSPHRAPGLCQCWHHLLVAAGPLEPHPDVGERGALQWDQWQIGLGQKEALHAFVLQMFRKCGSYHLVIECLVLKNRLNSQLHNRR